MEMELESLKVLGANNSMKTNRRRPAPLSAKQKCGRGVHAPSLLSAAVAYRFRSADNRTSLRL